MEFTFTCPLPNGLHARPASLISETANRFLSDCVLTNLRTGASSNAKSVLSIIGADVRVGDPCRIQVSGADEPVAGAGIRQFIDQVLPGCDDALAAPSNAGASLPRALQNTELKWQAGIPVSRGIGQGAVVWIQTLALPPEVSREIAGEPAMERERLDRALAAVRTKLELSSAGNAILKAHLAILNDVAFVDKLAERLAQVRSAGQAVVEASDFFVQQLRGSESLYIRERAIDMQDLCLQLIEVMYGPGLRTAGVELTAPSVVAAESLAPRQLLGLNRKWLQGLVLGSAGTTSHAVILARSLGIPAVAGVSGLAAGHEVVVDANRGLLITEITPQVQRFYDRERNAHRKREEALAQFAQAPAITTDGRRIEVAANVSSAEELEPAFEKGADGIGVFRTEMIFAGRDSAPSEEEQFAVYVRAARAAAGRPVIIRTVDIGGDKPLPYLNLPKEANPFLGYRGIRIYADHLELLDAQLRAIARASEFGRIQVMAPMVSCVEEVRWFKAQVARIQNELKAEGVAFDPAMPVGIMVEVPSVAFIMDQLCPEVDFFSIGTNDLAQYFFAVDRDNATVAGLSNVRDPGFVRLLKQIVDEAHKGGRWVGMCGEMAGDIRQLPLLIELGLDEISGSAAAIPVLKAGICRGLPLFDSELVLFSSDCESKDEAIREIVDAFYVDGRTGEPQKVEEAVWAREAVYSTGLGYGFAIPHCKTDTVIANSIGILKLKDPVEWGSMDGKPVKFVILLAMRESDAGGAHMKVFAQLARKLMHEEFREALLNAPDAQSVVAQLTAITSGPASTR